MNTCSSLIYAKPNFIHDKNLKTKSYLSIGKFTKQINIDFKGKLAQKFPIQRVFRDDVL